MKFRRGDSLSNIPMIIIKRFIGLFYKKKREYVKGIPKIKVPFKE